LAIHVQHLWWATPEIQHRSPQLLASRDKAQTRTAAVVVVDVVDKVARANLASRISNLAT
jgi:hypothetical protein